MVSEHGFKAVGIDGCKGKWLLVCLSDTVYDVHLYDTIQEIGDRYQTADIILIDMPIGLPESLLDVRPEALLRKQLKGRASTVFNVPCRQAVKQTDYESASSTNYRILGKKLSRQSFGILPKIREIDDYLEDSPHWKNRLLECHPEYCFALLNHGMPISFNKKTPDGRRARIDLLVKNDPQTIPLITLFRKKYPRYQGRIDDLLDAMVLAVIGTAGLRLGFHTLPPNATEDSRSIRMQILGANLSRP